MQDIFFLLLAFLQLHFSHVNSIQRVENTEVDNHRMQLICSPVLLGIIRFLLLHSFFCKGFFRSAQDFEQVDGENATAGIFVTFPGPGISNFNGAVDQVFCSVPSWSDK